MTFLAGTFQTKRFQTQSEGSQPDMSFVHLPSQILPDLLRSPNTLLFLCFICKFFSLFSYICHSSNIHNLLFYGAITRSIFLLSLFQEPYTSNNCKICKLKIRFIEGNVCHPNPHWLLQIGEKSSIDPLDIVLFHHDTVLPLKFIIYVNTPSHMVIIFAFRNFVLNELSRSLQFRAK